MPVFGLTAIDLGLELLDEGLYQVRSHEFVLACQAALECLEAGAVGATAVAVRLAHIAKEGDAQVALAAIPLKYHGREIIEVLKYFVTDAPEVVTDVLAHVEAVPDLTQMLSHPDEQVRVAAARALEDLGPESVSAREALGWCFQRARAAGREAEANQCQLAIRGVLSSACDEPPCQASGDDMPIEQV